MTVKFYKYQGTGNDFIMIDNRAERLSRHDKELVVRLCHRRFGIGADGLIMLQNLPGYDFEMVYFNSDGSQSMCGNGGRCAVQFAHYLGAVGNTCKFMAIDGEHEAHILPDGNVSLKMKDVETIKNYNNDFVINTGSPHYVSFVNGVEQYPVVNDAKAIRYNDIFKAEGINVNFVEKLSNQDIYVRTYERGVEDETYSCGTGVVAASLAFAAKSGQILDHVNIQTPGGQLQVRFQPSGYGYHNIYLIGPAIQVYEGDVEV